MKRKCAGLALLSVLVLTLGVSTTRVPLDNNALVMFDVAVTDKNGNPVIGLERRNFRVFEDNIEQIVATFSTSNKPLAVVILVESSTGVNYYEPAAGMVHSLRPTDWIALVSFDFRPEILVDFTHDKDAILWALKGLHGRYHREVALYDALYLVLDRMEGIAEKNAVFLVATGLESTIGKRTFADVLKKAEVSNATIYAVNLAQSRAVRPDQELGEEIRLSEAAHTLARFAEATGGLSFRPQVFGQYRDIYETVNADLRHGYTLGFVPAVARDGNLRKLKVEVTNTDIDHDGKPDKLKVRHRKGYRASGR